MTAAAAAPAAAQRPVPAPYMSLSRCTLRQKGRQEGGQASDQPAGTPRYSDMHMPLRNACRPGRRGAEFDPALLLMLMLSCNELLRETGLC